MTKKKELIVILDPNESIIEKYPEISGTHFVSIGHILNQKFSKEFKKENISGEELIAFYSRNFSPRFILEILQDYITGIDSDFVCVSEIYELKWLSVLLKEKDFAYFLALTPSIKKINDGIKLNKIILDIFLKADYYINYHKGTNHFQSEFGRLIKLIQNDFAVFIPRPEELHMYSAYTAMYNSHCLSRAVGSCITSAHQEQLAIGWNDVPKAGGGVYGTGDHRHCFSFKNPKLEKITPDCHKDIENKAIINELKESLKEQGITIGEKEDLIFKEIEKMQIKGLLEFSRSVHAEMHAIIKGSQLAGDKIVGSTLYVTAFPCHNCARHIILSGVKTVYFQEPFEKSRAIKLHNDSLELAEDNQNLTKEDKVYLIPYQGIGGNSMERFLKRNNDLKESIKDGRKYEF